MKRDMDLSRAILQQIEEKSDGRGCPPLAFPDRTNKEVSYHVLLLKDAGLVEAIDLTNSHDGLHMQPKRLTSAGHDFLEAIRNDTVWTKVKAEVKTKGGEIPFALVSGLAMQFAKSLFGIP